FATTYHDSGHREIEAGVPVDVELGRLYGMRDMPAAFKREDANQANVRWITVHDPYAALLAAMHRTGLRKKRYNTVSSAESDYASGGPGEAPLGMDAAFEDLDEGLREHLSRLDAPARDSLWFNYRLLQVYDLLSLYVCCDGYKDGELQPSALSGVPLAHDGSDGAEVRITPTGASSVRLDPYPLDVEPLTISAVARHMAPVNAKSESDVRAAYYRAPRELLTWQFAGR